MIFFLLGPAWRCSASLLPKARTALLWAAALLQLLMFAELAASIELLLIDGPLWAVAPVAALAALPFLIEADASRPGHLLALLLACSRSRCGQPPCLLPRSSAERPQAFTIDYVRDDDRGKAHWAVATKQAPLPPSWAAIRKVGTRDPALQRPDCAGSQMRRCSTPRGRGATSSAKRGKAAAAVVRLRLTAAART